MTAVPEALALSLIDAAQRRIALRERLIALLDDAAHALEIVDLGDLSSVNWLDATWLQSVGFLEQPRRLRDVMGRLAHQNSEDQDAIAKLRGGP
jgi:hypothetical protein